MSSLSKQDTDLALVNLRDSGDGLLLRAVYEGLYAAYFVAPDEREPFAYYYDRLILDAYAEDYALEMLVAVSPDRQVAGFVAFEIYRPSDCALVTYIAVAPAAQGKGVARRLLDAALACAPRHTHSGRLVAMLLECHRPERMLPGQDTYDPTARLSAMRRLGAGYIPLDYVQPALTAEGARSRDLALLYLDRPELPAATPETVACFLADFYVATGVPDPEQDADLQQMRDSLTRAARGDIAPEHTAFARRYGLPCLSSTSPA